jgi:Aminoglycoside-2''-adenylyltransferase
VSRAQLAAISRLDELFALAGIEYWIFGGWAVDFHAGRITRDHDDIDIAIIETDVDVVHRLLVADRWTITDGAQHERYFTYNRNGLDVDLALVAPEQRGHGRPTGTPEPGDWPHGSFASDVRDLMGTRARVVSSSSLVVDKSQPRDDPATRAKDASDVAVLRSMTA